MLQLAVRPASAKVCVKLSVLVLIVAWTSLSGSDGSSETLPFESDDEPTTKFASTGAAE